MTTSRLLSIGFTDYRSFRDEQTLDLKPLTLLYGRNNAGKSAVLRALVILSRSVSPDAASAWDVGDEDGPGRGASFRAFPWREKKTKFFALRLRWVTDGHEEEDLVELEQLGRFDPVHVRMIQPAGGPRWQFHPTDDGTVLFDRDDGVEEPLYFDALLPRVDQHDALDGFRRRLLTLRGAVQWLHGSRVQAPRSIALTGASPRSLQPDGRNAGVKLAMERAVLLPGINAFYAKIGRELRVDEGSRDDDARLLLDAFGRETLKIDLVDAGEGMGKVLPVLVAVRAASAGTGPRLVAVEDPDVHLHDDSERHLAEHFCDVVRENPSVTIIAETHSHTFLLAVQNQVRRGLACDSVNVVWAQTEGDGSTLLTPVQLLASGLPATSELRAAFREDGRLAAELAGLD